ncbi:MAG: family 2 glycosyl transferase [Bacteroidetes bacterium]|nr:MAG: family 2 glycosyl transferase [Bacteroidota bacterium]
MKISIVIRCFNEEEHIGKLLTGLEHQDYKNHEVIVVDSGSTDSTVAIASKFNIKLIKIKPEDFSFGYALNVGCAAATGDILLFGSAHVYPLYEDWLSKMAAPFIKDKEVALVYGKQRGDSRNKYSEHQIFKQWFPEESNNNQKIPFCNNANCAVRTSLWKEQPFDELLTGLEDLDWAKKIQVKGYKLVYESNATIIHVHEEKAANIRNRYMREAIALKRINPDTSFGFLTMTRLLVINIFHDISQAIEERVISKFFGEIFMFRYNQFIGTYNGYREKEVNLNEKLRNKYYYPPKRNVIAKSSLNQQPIDYNE